MRGEFGAAHPIGDPPGPQQKSAPHLARLYICTYLYSPRTSPVEISGKTTLESSTVPIFFDISDMTDPSRPFPPAAPCAPPGSGDASSRPSAAGEGSASTSMISALTGEGRSSAAVRPPPPPLLRKGELRPGFPLSATMATVRAPGPAGLPPGGARGEACRCWGHVKASTAAIAGQPFPSPRAESERRAPAASAAAAAAGLRHRAPVSLMGVAGLGGLRR